MTREEAIKWLKTFKGCTGMAELSQAFGVAIEALEQEPCEDAISRQAAIDCLSANFTIDGKENMETVVDYINGAFKQIKALPSVTPQKIGRWIRVDKDKLKCSECGIELQDWSRVERDEDNGEESFCQYTLKYCPNCGRRIEKE